MISIEYLISLLLLLLLLLLCDDTDVKVKIYQFMDLWRA